MSFVSELEILRCLKNENVIKLHEVYEDNTHLHLVYENLNGNELSFQIRKNGIFEENYAARIMTQILQAIQYLHSNGIIHRDVKPQVITLEDHRESVRAIITDFSLSVQASGKPQYTRCGSPGYMAPEIISGAGYTHKVDIFSAGCILYTLITGKRLFKGNTYQEVLSKNIKCKVNYTNSAWKNISHPAKNLLKRMLSVDPSIRPDASQCLQSEWITSSRLNHLSSDLQ